MESRFDEKLLKEIIEVCKEYSKPTFIYLFGSAAQGTMTHNSDLDRITKERTIYG